MKRLFFTIVFAACTVTSVHAMDNTASALREWLASQNDDGLPFFTKDGLPWPSYQNSSGVIGGALSDGAEGCQGCCRSIAELLKAMIAKIRGSN